MRAIVRAPTRRRMRSGAPLGMDLRGPNASDRASGYRGDNAGLARPVPPGLRRYRTSLTAVRVRQLPDPALDASLRDDQHATARTMPNADSGRAALAEECFLGTAGLVLRRQTCPRVRARRTADSRHNLRRDGAAARPVLVRAGHAVGDVDPLQRDAERGEGVTLWVRFLFIAGDAGASEFEHRQRRGCRLASSHRDCSPNQSYALAVLDVHATGRWSRMVSVGVPASGRSAAGWRREASRAG
jgi:hypothetical protein